MALAVLALDIAAGRWPIYSVSKQTYLSPSMQTILYPGGVQLGNFTSWTIVAEVCVFPAAARLDGLHRPSCDRYSSRYAGRTRRMRSHGRASASRPGSRRE